MTNLIDSFWISSNLYSWQAELIKTEAVPPSTSPHISDLFPHVPYLVKAQAIFSLCVLWEQWLNSMFHVQFARSRPKSLTETVTEAILFLVEAGKRIPYFLCMSSLCSHMCGADAVRLSGCGLLRIAVPLLLQWHLNSAAFCETEKGHLCKSVTIKRLELELSVGYKIY